MSQISDMLMLPTVISGFTIHVAMLFWAMTLVGLKAELIVVEYPEIGV